MNSMKAILSIQNLSKSFPKFRGNALTVLKKINLEIQEGEFFCILGPSGSGKSTLLRALSGLENGYTGHVFVRENARIAFVFQQFALLPWLTVQENIEIVLRGLPMNQSERKRRVERELRRLGLKKFSGALPKELSGGMRQRAGIARALAVEPDILYMDEPFSELDTFTAERLRQEFLTIWKQRKMTVVMVTHLVEEAVELADRIAVLTPRPAQIELLKENPLKRPRSMRAAETFAYIDELKRAVEPD